MEGLNVCKVLLVLGALTRHGFGATLDLTVTPTETSQLSQEDVYISCQPGTSLYAKDILLIKIRNSGMSSPLAGVYRNHKAVAYNKNTTSGIKAVGQINQDVLLDSFLTITLKDPTYEQSGSYECELSYVDVNGEVKVAKSSGDVKITKPDILYVDGVIDDLRKKVERLNHTSSTQAKVIKHLEKNIKTNAQDFVSVTKELNETKAELHKQTSYTASQAKVIKDQEKKIVANARDFESERKLLKAVTQELHETKAKLRNKKEMKCPNESWRRVDDKVCFKGYKTEVTWQKAKETCRKGGGTLVSIHTHFHHDMADRVAQSMGMKGSFWIGLNDLAYEGYFAFDDGTQMSWLGQSIWEKDQPNNYDDSQDCVQQYLHDATWNDYYCSEKLSFVCQTSTRPQDFW